MTKMKMPTLSTRGWLSTPELIIDEVLSNYLAANPSQTLLFSGNVVSLQYAIYKTNNDGNQLATRVKADLDKLYGQYSKQVEIEVNYTEDYGKINISISGTVNINGKNYDIQQSVSDTASVFDRMNSAIKE